MEADAQGMRDTQTNLSRQLHHLREEQSNMDDRSIFVGNIHHEATTDEIQAHFQSCGSIKRVTIVFDKITGHHKG